MRSHTLVLGIFLACFPSFAQTANNSPTDSKAQKTYLEALQELRQHHYLDAFDKFKKANKQDGGHCYDCLRQILSLAPQAGDSKAADAAARELIAEARSPKEAADAHYQRGTLLLQEGIAKKKAELFEESDQEFKSILATNPKDMKAMYADAVVLAHLNQDDAAKHEFQQVVELTPPGSVDRLRVMRFAARPELARARMAPAFSVTTESGQRISMDELQGKVVLMDFWATWCGPCREALPHMKRIAQKFSGEPLVVLSVSLDADEQKWKSFIAQNEMTWPQYRDGGFEGRLARVFGVDAIPHTFTIDSDGVLQDEKVGDASIEGKLKKLIAQARQLQETRAEQASAK